MSDQQLALVVFAVGFGTFPALMAITIGYEVLEHLFVTIFFRSNENEPLSAYPKDEKMAHAAAQRL